MKKSPLKARFLFQSLGMAVLAHQFVSPAFAQAEPSSAPQTAERLSDDQLGEIIVTAQKRSQSLNNVGLSITAADGEQLTKLGIRETGDLVKISPGLTFTKSQDGTPLFTIRGVGFNDYTLGASPAVSVYVDQVPLVYSAYTQGATLDLERVEVLKGPQGILFGQNSTGGAINYIAAKPTADFQAGVKASYGRFDTFDGEAFISGPITDTLGFRLAGGATQSGNWQYSYTRDDKIGAQDILRGRLLLDWKPTDTLSFLFSANGWRNKSDTQAAQLVGLKLQQDASALGLYDTEETLSRIAAFRAYPLAPGDARSADWDMGRNLKRDDSLWQLSLRGDLELGSGIILTSLTSYTRFRQDYGLDRDGTTLQNAGVESRGNVKTVTQELRLSGESDRLNWMLGGNYAKNKIRSADNFLVNDSTNTAILPGFGVDNGNTTITENIRDLAAFGNVEYKVTDQLTILAGARYTDTKNDYTACMRGGPGQQFVFWQLSQAISGVAQPAPDANTCVNMDETTFLLIRTPFQSKLYEDNVSWRVGVNYKPTRDVLLYSLVSRGYKSGNFPTVPASTTQQFAPVKQESVTAYEIGIKATALDRRLQVNAAIFHYTYDDKQIRGLVIDPIFNQLEKLVNVPKSRINGAEIDITARPMSGLTLRTAGTWIDSKVLNFVGINNDRVLGDYRGSELPFSPKWQLVGDAEYRWALSSDLNAFAGANILYNSKTNSTLGAPESSRIKAFATLDLRAGISGPDDKWTLSVWGRNVTDTYYWTNQFVTQDVIVRYTAMPATFGLSASYRF
ncbi:TonB-dependent receptor [Sphingobium sp. CAP-1]|uniref:TonB-dependent receptor n=1 Tax=Sphingobium sp. CAP-1 TaxID=2676077 RepID=UPI0018AD190B|nr:TonB-dependent receptor [Sphingobium sp. CAP-1]